MPMDEPVPIRRAAVGCLLVALAVAAIALIVRPAIFSVAPPRDDSVVTVAAASEVTAGPIRRELILTARTDGPASGMPATAGSRSPWCSRRRRPAGSPP